MGAYDDYLSAVVDRFWVYAEREFGDRPELLKRPERSANRPPEFVVGAAEHNLLYPPNAEPRVRQAIVTSLPTSKRHRHFASMRSLAGARAERLRLARRARQGGRAGRPDHGRRAADSAERSDSRDGVSRPTFG